MLQCATVLTGALLLLKYRSLRSSVAQRQSNRLLTDRLLVRVQPEEPQGGGYFAHRLFFRQAPYSGSLPVTSRVARLGRAFRVRQREAGVTSGDAFDFARYFARVHRGALWHEMHVGMAVYAGATRPGLAVLDVGCGPGRLVHHLQGQQVQIVGADADPAVLAKSHSLFPGLPLVRALAEALPWPDGVFDAVLAGNLLFLVAEPLVVLREMVRVTRPGGRVALWNPSEHMSRAAAAAYVRAQPTLDPFEQKHLVNWARVAENNRRWSAADLQSLFAHTDLIEFESVTVIEGLARYVRGRKCPA